MNITKIEKSAVVRFEVPFTGAASMEGEDYHSCIKMEMAKIAVGIPVDCHEPIVPQCTVRSNLSGKHLITSFLPPLPKFALSPLLFSSHFLSG